MGGYLKGWIHTGDENAQDDSVIAASQLADCELNEIVED